METVTEIISAEALLAHWQGHRTLTRRVIEAFPEKELFEFSIGGMRPFSKIVMELLGIAGPGLKEIVSGQSNPLNESFDDITTKSQLLEKWDGESAVVNEYFSQISPARFHETFNLFGMYEAPVIYSIQYFIDNEIHHRGQGYVYLRALGVEPPPFWER